MKKWFLHSSKKYKKQHTFELNSRKFVFLSFSLYFWGGFQTKITLILLPLNAPNHVIKQSIQLVQFVEDSCYGLQRDEILPPPLIEMLNGMSEMANALKLLANDRFNEETVKPALAEIKLLLSVYLKEQDDFYKNHNDVFSLSTEAFDKAFKSINGLIGELIFISDGKVIDETTPEYQHFLMELVEESKKEKSIPVSKNELMALFD